MMSHKLEQLLRKMIDKLNYKITQLQLKQNSQGQVFQVALTWTYLTCARHYYPKWASYFLDEAFQAHGADRLLACYLKGSAYLTPTELATLWADQMLWLSAEMRQRHLAELIPVAARFLCCLEAELRGRLEFPANFADPTQETNDKVVDRSSATILAQSVTIL
jgi:hypothetical protein